MVGRSRSITNGLQGQRFQLHLFPHKKMSFEGGVWQCLKNERGYFARKG